MKLSLKKVYLKEAIGIGHKVDELPSFEKPELDKHDVAITIKGMLKQLELMGGGDYSDGYRMALTDLAGELNIEL